MKALLTLGATAGALALLAGCTTADYERVRDMNPFNTTETGDAAPAETEGAPIEDKTGELSEAQVGKPAEPAATSYVIPAGGPNTFSLSVSSCLDGCEVVNVMVDPDNYWQRTSADAVISGQGRDGLYDDVTNAFQAQGFYAFQGKLDITPGSEKTCPDHEAGGQAFFMSMSRNSGNRVVTYDSGCAGSASADAAADAINTVITISDYMAIVDGNVVADAEPESEPES